ncbi:MAG: HD-GYP domain-containing protein [Gemmatimonadaceae bacterium]|nr:HD-GYP domain-containing protein [Gemmatimonadaceae bacterium]
MRALPVVVAVGLLAVVTLWFVSGTTPPKGPHFVVGAVLVALGLLAEVLAHYDKGKSTVSAASVVPYAAGLLCAPDWRLLAGVAIGQVAVQVWHRRALVKATFNIAQLVLQMGVALLVQLSLTDGDFIIRGSGFGDALGALLLPAAGYVVAQMVVNHICISAIMASVTDAKFMRLLTEAMAKSVRTTALQIVFVVYLAWLAANLGWIGALGMALPILALRQLMKTAADLTNVTEELLDLMVAAIEARDPYTSGHSKRVSATAVTIARALGLSEAAVERVQVAALLHDVGKIYEEFAKVLSKEGRLTPDEWEVMKRHPVRSSELVGLVRTLKDVVPAVRHHHENWDGTGYPDGVRGDAIPLASRIIMFADTLDAITTDRPYRKALDPDEARREFIKFRGKQFDPTICDLVVSSDVWPQLYAAAKHERLKSHSSDRATVVA